MGVINTHKGFLGLFLLNTDLQHLKAGLRLFLSSRLLCVAPLILSSLARVQFGSLKYIINLILKKIVVVFYNELIFIGGKKHNGNSWYNSFCKTS